MIVDFIPAIFNTWLNITMERLLVDGAVLYVAHTIVQNINTFNGRIRETINRQVSLTLR